MPDKKRNQKNEKSQKNSLKRHPNTLKTFDDVLEMQMNDTIAAVVRAETYPSQTQNTLSSEQEETETEEIYHSPKMGKRYSEDPYTVAQNYIDRVEFRL